MLLMREMDFSNQACKFKQKVLQLNILRLIRMLNWNKLGIILIL